MSDTVDKKSESMGQDCDFDHTRSTNHQPVISPKTLVVTADQANESQQNLKSGFLVNDIQRFPFARTRSSPELTDTYQYLHFQGTRDEPLENGNSCNRQKNVEPETEKNEPSSLNHAPPQHSLDPSVESNMYHHEDMQQEEQDHVNMMASSAFHGFNGPVNLALGRLPFPMPPSFLAPLGYTQRNMAGMISSNMPFIDPQLSGMQFPHVLVPHYFPGVIVTSISEDSVNENNIGSVELKNHEIWREPDLVSPEIVQQDDNKPQSSSTGMNYIPPARRVGGSGGLVRSQHKNNKEKRDRLRDSNHPDLQENKLNDMYSDDRATSSRFSSAAHSNSTSNSTRGKTSSESSREEITVNKSTKEKRGKKTVNPMESTMSDRFQSEEDDQDWIPPMSFVSESGSQTVAPMHVSRPHGPDMDPAQTSGSSSTGPMINPRQQTMENSRDTPLTFYPTGPPIPFLTMLPFYNGSTDPSASSFENIENGDTDIGGDPSVDFSPRGAGPGESPNGQTSDILNSDFASHWRNQQFGQLCQSPRHHVYPSPFMVHLQGHVPWDGPGRPFPNMTQLMNYGPRLVPVTPFQSGPSRPNVYQQFVEDMPRYRSGTGTYLPNHKVGVRRGNFNYDRSDNHGDRDSYTKSRSSGRNQNHNRNQMDKSSARMDRSGSGSSGSRMMNSHGHDSFSAYQTQNGQVHPKSSQNGPTNLTYGMYPLHGVTSNGSNSPAVVMMYPFEQNAGGFVSQNGQLEFGSTGMNGEGSRSRGT